MNDTPSKAEFLNCFRQAIEKANKETTELNKEETTEIQNLYNTIEQLIRTTGYSAQSWCILCILLGNLLEATYGETNAW